ncbi:hypothetical protein CEXT_279081 [Caerostris extrusa]|uniref:Secreted protein n=1 Tax=Caerostris extrusa TaxID=172846 RepID=A0AAV4Y547_CAEEX|nr:hypothetical protein CEXT_279081 [Caerostris extrusa]
MLWAHLLLTSKQLIPPVARFHCKRTCLFEFLTYFLQTLGDMDHSLFSCPLMTGIYLKLLACSRRSCKRASKAERDPSLRDS